MNQKKILLLVVVALVLLLAGAYPLYNRLRQSVDTDQLATLPQQQTQPAETTQPTESRPDNTEPDLPDFTVSDGNGNSVKLSDYTGKPVVLNFWASWCGPCKSEMPEFQEVYEEMGDQVQFLMVNSTTSESTIENAKSFVWDNGYTFPVLYDTRAEAVTVFGIDAFPTTFFLNKTGEPVAYVVGAINRETLLKGIDMITK